jgi:biotin transport system substrate-specific component
MGLRISVRGIVFSALFAALTVVLDFLQINLGFSPVPITLGNMGIMLAGAILGGLYGFLSIFLLIILTAFGLPLLDGAGGLGIIFGPSGGYLWAWPFCALFTGLFAARVRGKGILVFVKVFVIVEVFGSLLCYVTGVPWLAHAMHLPLQKALVLGFYPYLPGDTLKAVFTTLIALSIRRVYPVERIIHGSHASQVMISK